MRRSLHLTMPATRRTSAPAVIAILLLNIVLLSGLETETAQGQPALQYGTRVEAISSAVTDDLAGQTESRWGLGAAIYLQRRIGGPISVRLELAYLPRGVRQSFRDRSSESAGRRVTADTRFHYLSLPVLVQAGASAGSAPINFYALLGPRLDVLIGSNSGTFSFSDGTVSARLADRYDSTTIGFSGGLGVAVDVGSVTVTGELLQHRDLTASADEGGTNLVNTTVDALRNVATGVSIGVRW